MLMKGNRVPVLTGSQTTKTHNALCDLAAYGRKRLIIMIEKFWWSQTGSNRRPPACKAGALPAELWPRLDVLKQKPSGGSGGYAGPKPPQARVICQWLPSVNPFFNPVADEITGY